MIHVKRKTTIRDPSSSAGDDVIVPTAGSCGVAKERMAAKDGMTCHDWFFCTKKLDKEKVLSTILKKK